MPAVQTTTNWVVLERADLLNVLSAEVLRLADANVGTDLQPNDPLDTTQPTRSAFQLQSSVETFRDAVKAVGRYPLSVTTGAVPYSAIGHVLNLAAYALINSTPNLPMVVIEGQPTFGKFYDAAMKYLDEIRKGGQIPQPSDPTGEDYLTAVCEESTDPDTGVVTPANPTISLVRWSDFVSTKADWERGYITTSTGSHITLPVDDMRSW